VRVGGGGLGLGGVDHCRETREKRKEERRYNSGVYFGLETNARSNVLLTIYSLLFSELSFLISLSFFPAG
jgi:hypothetical protein